jgi:hypothetical protein
VYKITQSRQGAWRRLVKAFDQLSGKVYDSSFDGGGANVDANHDGLI